ncbi:DUF397 domain-containing protein [Sphaerisporangium aureirubrum]|uniref:DUF397 domain-containing protein n=1 Tax=Sphaerisporangium aureirubrum TaxID=1544736 RepID=A0ABW1NQ78_9ACTN
MDVIGVWRKSSYSSGNGGNCVEVAGGARGVAVRDTKERTRGMLWVSPSGWRGFLAAVKVGEFDR